MVLSYPVLFVFLEAEQKVEEVIGEDPSQMGKLDNHAEIMSEKYAETNGTCECPLRISAVFFSSGILNDENADIQAPRTREYRGDHQHFHIPNHYVARLGAKSKEEMQNIPKSNQKTK